MASFNRVALKLGPEESTFGKLKSITVRVFIHNCTGTLYVTDIFLQGGSVATGWVGHPSEIRWTLDG